MATRHYRAHQRFMVEIAATIRTPHRGISARGTTTDLGVGGGAFALDTPLRLGEAVEIEFEGKSDTPVRGKVAWVGWGESSAVRLGIRFNTGDVDQLSAILDALGVAA